MAPTISQTIRLSTMIASPWTRHHGPAPQWTAPYASITLAVNAVIGVCGYNDAVGAVDCTAAFDRAGVVASIAQAPDCRCRWVRCGREESRRSTHRRTRRSTR